MESNRTVLKTNTKRLNTRGAFNLLGTMRSFLILLAVVLLNLSATAQLRKSTKSSSLENHYLISGVIYNCDWANDKETPAAYVQIVIYQNKELFVAFFGGADGTYSFYLPIGFEYEVAFGGSAFVNKKILLDAAQFPEERKPRKILFDVSLFRNVEGADFSTLEEPYGKIIYDPELDMIRPDEDYSVKRKLELERALKKARKILKSSKS